MKDKSVYVRALVGSILLGAMVIIATVHIYAGSVGRSVDPSVHPSVCP